MRLRDSRQVDQSAHCRHLGDVVEGPLPADILRLLGLPRLLDIEPVECDVVCRTAEGQHGHDCHGIREEVRQREAPWRSTPAKRPREACVATTKNFFVRYISSNGLQKGLSDHGRIRSEVQKVTCASLMPKSLNMIRATRLSMMNGSPIAK